MGVGVNERLDFWRAGAKLAGFQNVTTTKP
jgi:hypothetical protein